MVHILNMKNKKGNEMTFVAFFQQHSRWPPFFQLMTLYGECHILSIRILQCGASAAGKAAPQALHECDPHFLSRERKRASPVQKKGVSHCGQVVRRDAALADCTAHSAALPR